MGIIASRRRRRRGGGVQDGNPNPVVVRNQNEFKFEGGPRNVPRVPNTFDELSPELERVEEEIRKYILQNTSCKSPASTAVRMPDQDAKTDNDDKPEFSKQHSELVREAWCKERKIGSIQKEYQKAFTMICLQPEWIRYTKSLAVLRKIGEFTEENKDIKKALSDHNFLKSTVLKVVTKAYKLRSRTAAISHKCLICGEVIYTTLVRLWSSLGWRRPHMTLGLQYWLHLGEADELIAVLNGVTERGARCLSVQRQAFDLVVKHADFLLWRAKRRHRNRPETKNPQGDAKLTYAEAMDRCRTIFEEYVDQHKLMAFDSAFRGPTTAYYMDQGRAAYPKYFRNHGLNWWLASMMSTIGMQMPIIPLLDDSGSGGVCAFWHAPGTTRMWKEFQRLENFGRRYDAIPKLKRMRKKSFGTKIISQNDFFGIKLNTSPQDFATRVVTCEPSVRAKFALYLERLCHFFTRDFFCSKAISILMQENADNPQLLGFRECMEVIFQEYRKDRPDTVTEESFVEYVYDEEKTKYDTARVNNVFHYVGITKERVPEPTRSRRRSAAQSPVNRSVPQVPQKLMDTIEKMVKEGSTFMAIMRECRRLQLCNNAEFMVAYQKVKTKNLNLAS